MEDNRVEYLKTLMEDMPGDPFIPHALGIEYTRLGDDTQAVEYFEKVIDHHPDYVGTYYHLGKAYERLGVGNKALSVYDEGMKQANAVGDLRTASELQEAAMLIRDSND